MASRFCILLALVLVHRAFAGDVRARDFDISLTLSAGGEKQTAKAEADAPPPPKDVHAAARPAMQVSLGEKCTAAWKVTCNSKEPLKDILVHFYVVKIDRAGQAAPPLEASKVVIESAQTISFNARDSTSAAVQFVPDRPGLYLCRVETRGPDDDEGHIAAGGDDAVIELTVKPRG